MQNSAADRENATSSNHVADAHGPITPVCMYCSKIRGASKHWHTTDEAHLDPATNNLSHTACPACYATAVRLLEEELRGDASLSATA